MNETFETGAPKTRGEAKFRSNEEIERQLAKEREEMAKNRMKERQRAKGAPGNKE